LNEKDRARKLDFQQRKRGGRRKDGPVQTEGRIESDIQEIVDSHTFYDKSARPNDTRAICQVEYVPDIGKGDVPALHARWQEEGWIRHSLSRMEAEQLHRLGFRTIHNKDLNCEDMYWRKRGITHLWIGMLARTGDDREDYSACWAASQVSKSSQLVQRQQKWEILAKIDEPILPFFEEYDVSHKTMVKESLVEAWVKIQYTMQIPDFVVTNDFWQVLKMVCDDGVERFDMQYDPSNNGFVLQSVEVQNTSEHIRSGTHRELLNKTQS